MADRTYTVTVASGELYIVGGTGNVFYLDGVRDLAIEWVEGGTLRFIQNDSSNNNHPLLFTTSTTDPGNNIITSGVTYYLDGPSNQASYSNTSSFNAASYRYVEITPPNETDFNFYCYVHGIGMGGLIDITQNTWGARVWSVNEWGQQQGVDIDLIAPSSLTATVGAEGVEAFNTSGWGRDRWGDENWGESAITLDLPGFSLTSTVNLPEENVFRFPGWGTLDWGENSWGDVLGSDFTLVAPAGLTATLGEFDISDTTVGLSELSATSTIGTLTTNVDFNTTLTGLGLVASEGLLTTDDHSVGLTGFSLTSSVAPLNPSDVMGLTGLSAATEIGDVTISSDPVTVIVAPGARLVTLGTLTSEPNSIVDLPALSTTSTLGTLTTTQLSNVFLTGLSATVSLNDAEIIYRYYHDLTPFTGGTYTDLTA